MTYPCHYRLNLSFKSSNLLGDELNDQTSQWILILGREDETCSGDGNVIGSTWIYAPLFSTRCLDSGPARSVAAFFQANPSFGSCRLESLMGSWETL